MKKKNGFTLIELLAIIVILAIIAVITVPIILNIIENSRKGAATDSAYGYKDAVNKYYVTELSDNNNLKLEGEYTVSDGNLTGKFEGPESTSKTVQILVSGEKPSSGSLTYSNNVLTEGWLVIGDYRVTFNENGTVTTTKNSGSSSNEQGNGGNNQQHEQVASWDKYYYYSIDNDEWYNGSSNIDHSDNMFPGFAREDSSLRIKELCIYKLDGDYSWENIDHSQYGCIEAGKSDTDYLANKIIEIENLGYTCESYANDVGFHCDSIGLTVSPNHENTPLWFYTINTESIEIYSDGTVDYYYS